MPAAVRLSSAKPWAALLALLAARVLGVGLLPTSRQDSSLLVADFRAVGHGQLRAGAQAEAVVEVQGIGAGIRIVPKFLITVLEPGCAFVFVIFAIFGFKDLHAFVVRAFKPEDERGCASSSSNDVEEVEAQRGYFWMRRISKGRNEPIWSTFGLMGLTSYRFYTGFLSATWLPYLLAMEGDDLWHENQSLFMGTAKLIYGITILINPVMGRIGDHSIKVSHGLGRRLFVHAGVLMAASGIFLCLYAARHWSLSCFLFGILIWRLGESINDVTTEAIIPEMVGSHQFQIAGSIKAAQFLLGGLLGYVLLIFMVNVHYSWLYYAYMMGMVLCALPAMILLRNDDNVIRPETAEALEESFFEACRNAYMGPVRQKGGFPRYCLAVFIFTLGTSPMFFLLLIVRDLLGVDNAVQLQRLFSVISIVFFVSAALASILTGVGAPRPGGPAHDDAEERRTQEEKRWRRLVATQVVFGIIVLIIPSVVLIPDKLQRVRMFMAIAASFGACFGSGYARLQDAAWQVLPPGVKGKANAMGFNTMCRLLGVGIGNFAAGLCLDLFKTGNVNGATDLLKQGPGAALINIALERPGVASQTDQVYGSSGYVVMCTSCCLLNMASAYLTSTIPSKTTDHHDGRCREAG